MFSQRPLWNQFPKWSACELTMVMEWNCSWLLGNAKLSQSSSRRSHSCNCRRCSTVWDWESWSHKIAMSRSRLWHIEQTLQLCSNHYIPVINDNRCSWQIQLETLDLSTVNGWRHLNATRNLEVIGTRWVTVPQLLKSEGLNAPACFKHNPSSWLEQVKLYDKVDIALMLNPTESVIDWSRFSKQKEWLTWLFNV